MGKGEQESQSCCVCTPQVGQEAPGFCGKAVVGSEAVDLCYDKGVLKVGDKVQPAKWTVLFFYPLDFTGICQSEIVAFQAALAQFQELKANVVGVSVDSPYAHLAFKETLRKPGGPGEIGFPLLSDLTKKTAQDYGVLLATGFAARGVFILDEKGVLQSVTVNAPTVGRNIEEVLRTLEACQHVAAHGQGCPANWKRAKKA